MECEDVGCMSVEGEGVEYEDVGCMGVESDGVGCWVWKLRGVGNVMMWDV